MSDNKQQPKTDKLINKQTYIQEKVVIIEGNEDNATTISFSPPAPEDSIGEVPNPDD